MDQLETVDYQLQDRVATITLNRADMRNALNTAMRRDLLVAVEQANNDPQVRVVILTGRGASFCAGADLVGSAPEGTFEEFLIEEFKPFMMAISESAKPYICAINGAAAGAGSALAMVGDLAIMSEEAYLLQSFARIALLPDCGSTWLLVNAVGRKRAYELIVSGEKLYAPQCLQWGLVNRVVPAGQLMEKAQQWAQEIADKAPLAMQYSKQALYYAQNNTLSDTFSYEAKLQNLISDSEDLVEGVTAFFEKRKPNFKGG